MRHTTRIWMTSIALCASFAVAITALADCESEAAGQQWQCLPASCPSGTTQIQKSGLCPADQSGNEESCCVTNPPQQNASPSPNTTCKQQAQGNPYACRAQCASNETQTDSSDCIGQNQFCCIAVPGSTQLSSSTAPTITPGSSINLPDPLNLGGKGLTELTRRVIQSFLGLIGAISLLVFVTAGVIYMTAMDEKRVSRAKAMMANALIGIVIIMFSYVIANLFFGLLTK